MNFCRRDAEDAEMTRVDVSNYLHSASSASLRQEFFLLGALSNFVTPFNPGHILLSGLAGVLDLAHDRPN